MSVTMMGMTTRATVPKATMEFIDHVVLYVEAIYQEVEHSLFTTVVRMLNVVCLRGRVVAAKEVFTPS